MIEVRNLSKSFKGRKVIDDISLSVDEGDVYGFLGSNGSGKTTTIRMLLNLIYPNKGTIKLNEYDISRDFSKAIKRVGAIVEIPKFHSYLSGRKNLLLMANLIDDIEKHKVDEVLELVGLADRAEDKVKTYSLGMRQRLGIANALLCNPRLVILDEPTNGLDPQGMKEIRDLICRLSSENNITFFISTHLLHEVEQMCNKVAILNHGKIIAQGKVEDLVNIDYELVEIYTPLIDKAISEIENLDFVRNIKKSTKSIFVQIEKDHSIDLNRALINNNIDIKYLIPHNQSLEEYFIKLINGSEENDQTNNE